LIQCCSQLATAAAASALTIAATVHHERVVYTFTGIT